MQFTLRAVRISCGYTLWEAAKECGVSKKTLRKYEKDSSNIMFSLMLKLRKLYDIPADYFYLGSESDCIEHNRARSMKAHLIKECGK